MMKLIYRGTLLILAFVFIFLFRFETAFLQNLGNYLSFFIIVIGIIIIIFWYTNNYVKFHNKTIRFIYKFWLLMLVWFLLVPFLFFGSNLNSQFFIQGMYHDYRYLLFSVLPFMFIGNNEKKYFQKIFDKVGFIAVISGIVSFILVDKSFTAISGREGGWSISYYLWWVVLCAYPYIFLKNLYLKEDKKGILLLILHILLSLFFLKRSGFVGALLLIFLVLILSENRKKYLKTVSIVGIMLIGLLIFFGDYIDILLLRFQNDIFNIEQFDRNLERKEFFRNVSIKQLLTGFGANNYLKMSYIGIQDNAVNSMHIGFYNLIYKGGVLYVLFVGYLGLQIVALRKFIKYNAEIKIGFIIGIIYLISFSYENGWSYMPIHFFSLLPIYRAIYLKDEIIRMSKLYRT